jgi:hypothetical protein
LRIQSAERRLTARIWAAALLVDVVIAGIASYFLAGDDQFWITTFWIWLAIQVVSIGFQLLGIVRVLTARALGAFKPAKDTMLTALETHKFPVPATVVHSVDDYLDQVASREDCAVDTRVIAATLMGGRFGIKQFAGFFRGYFIDSAHEQALTEYAARHGADERLMY